MTGRADGPRDSTDRTGPSAARPVPATSPLQAAARLKDHPALPALIPSLPPRVLARLYSVVGLADAGALMTMTPPALLNQALEEAIWTEHDRGLLLDSDTLLDWLEVWAGEGDEFVADQLASLHDDLLATCFAELVEVQDSHVTAFSRDLEADAELAEPEGWVPEPLDPDVRLLRPGAFTELFDRFLVAPLQDDEWNVVHHALTALWVHHPERALALVARLAAEDSTGIGYDHRRVLREDVAATREDRRAAAGFVSIATARSFLASALATPVDELRRLTAYDPETRRHLSRLGAFPPDDAPAPDEPAATADAAPGKAAAGTETGTGSPAADAEPAAGPGPDPDVWALLAAAGVVAAPSPAGLLTGPADASGLLLRQRLDRLADSDPEAVSTTAAELAYLANVMLAGVDLPGPQREDQARTLAFATANLGLVLLEREGPAVTLGEEPGLVRPFLLAWRILAELPERVARAFSAALASPAAVSRLEHRQWLRAQALEAQGDLESAVRSRRFDAAREAVTLLSLVFEPDACRAIVELLDSPPRFPALLEGGARDAWRWMREPDDLARVGALLAGLAPKAGPKEG